MATSSRSLTQAERSILALLQQHYGPWNTTEDVFESEGDAIVFVKDQSGESPVCVNLTVCASVYEAGQVNLDDLKKQWLGISN